MEYKLIATDMDGTLLTNDHKITKENKKAIIAVQKKGVKFVLASGRPSFAMYKYAKELEMDKLGGYILAFNGGQLIDCATNEVIFHEGLDRNDIEKVLKFSKEINIPMVLYAEDTVYGTEATDNVMFEVSQCDMKFKQFTIMEELDNDGINKTTKCMIIGEASDIKKAEKLMKEKYGQDYFIAISNPIFLEIANKNVNKGKTLRKLGEIVGVKLEEMIAAGDGGNDIPLLEVVGMPVAVENAIPAVKEISKFETTNNNNNALKAIIEEFFEF